jgi:hypothetical protein
MHDQITEHAGGELPATGRLRGAGGARIHCHRGRCQEAMMAG